MATNAVTLIGNVQDDPELRFTPTGLAVSTFSVRITTKPAKGEPRSQWFDVTAWRSLAENVCESLQKGDRVIVSGRLEQQTWETDEGQKRSKVTVTADTVGADLTFGSVEVHRTERVAAAAGAAPIAEF